ncbi:DUF397 domain-containing protein [Streptomyces sp. A5-4]|uniref:DUF397 domain-containing protein n=1 Tax=Streptomyces sp. A5-4 TaxID=3384771 RepID=UPI003DAA23DA
MNSTEHAIHWRKSSYSGGGEGNCLEVADNIPGVTPVRDSKTPHGPAVIFNASAWSCFVTAVKDDQLPCS